MIETKSMTNLTTDDEFNPFLTFLKCKSDLILPSKVSKKKAMEIWAEYKKAINKVLPVFRSHVTSQSSNVCLILEVLSRFIVRKGGSLEKIMKRVDCSVTFAVEYMCIFYQREMFAKQSVDLSLIFKFGIYQHLLKNEEISSLINESVNNESFSQAKQITLKFNEILTQVKEIPKVALYFKRDSAQEKADKLAILQEKRSRPYLPRSSPASEKNNE